jgi:hypothetical protein
LSFKQLKGRHTGKRLSKEVLDILIEFDLAEKLFCITTDNAGNMGKLMKCLSKRLRKQGINWDASENHISCLNHVLNLAVQAFLKKIKALPPKEVEIPDLQDKEDDDEVEDLDGDDGNDDIEIDFDGDEEDEDGDEDILDNPAAVEGEDEYDNIEADFQGTMKKLRGIAKVRVVANKMRFSALLNRFCTLQVLYSKLTGRKHTVAVSKRNNLCVPVNTTNLSHSS